MEKMNLTGTITSMCWLLLILVISTFIVSFVQESPLKEANVAFCGTTNTVPSLNKADPNYSLAIDGKVLFKTNCAQCHNRNMKDDLTGPALAGVRERWKDFPKEDLYNWIRNSQKLIMEKHPRGLALWKGSKDDNFFILYGEAYL